MRLRRLPHHPAAGGVGRLAFQEPFTDEIINSLFFQISFATAQHFSLVIGADIKHRLLCLANQLLRL